MHAGRVARVAAFAVFAGALVTLVWSLLAVRRPAYYASLQADVAFDGHNVSVIKRCTLDACFSRCSAFGARCKAFVYRDATCVLKDTVGHRRFAPGAVSSLRTSANVTAPVLRAANASVAFATSEWAHPLPALAFGYLPSAAWLDEQVTGATAWPMHTFTLVESIGECAHLAASVHQPLFSYATATQQCIVFEYDASAQPTVAAYMRGVDGDVHFDAVPAAFLVADADDIVAPLADCQLLCRRQAATCAGYRVTDAGKCQLVAPVLQVPPVNASNNSIAAGWVHVPVRHHQVDGVRYVSLRGYTLGESPGTVSTAASLDACATAAATAGAQLFTFTPTSKRCVVTTLATVATVAVALVDYPASPVVHLRAAFPPGTVVPIATAVAGSVANCSRLCQVSRNECFGTTHDNATGLCTLFKAHRGASTVGWVAPTRLPTTVEAPTKAAFFVTAHQDDHELFMVGSFVASLGEPRTKTVVVYTTAGDLFGSLRWPGREQATLQGTTVGVEYFGLYDPRATITNVTVKGHSITRVAVGNAVHYCLRLPEAGAARFLDASFANASVSMAPVDKPAERYTSYAEVRGVVQAIMEREADGIPKVEFHTSEHGVNASVRGEADHQLHKLTGAMVASIVAAHPTWAKCAMVQFYFGYQKWSHAPDLEPATADFQRYLWLREFAGVMNPKNTTNGWDFHVKQLGRMYISRTLGSNTTSCLPLQ
ncbi:hypothetical protein ACHHYP_01287 [Achlya hypogyna]|uniref:Uncharacterized protein n=1 Tax=Achlya hypogyna TaxID=1202772 RepID=A0A1V9Z933_ACHHY|nr:hypothetical protein ACHHYP_01287 [Achlya hypogyna]